MMTTFTWPHPHPPGSGEEPRRVQVAGSFNDWNPVDMTRREDGTGWTLTLPSADVPAGKHEFKFVLDGHQWVHDEQQPTVANEHGSHNNFVIVQTPVSARKASTAGSVGASIEVERKFEVPEDFRSVLPERGFVLVEQFEEEKLGDVYFDTAEYALMRANHWLRKRNGDWELKYPLSDPTTSTPEREATTLYHETSNVADIEGKIRLLPTLRDSPSLSEMCSVGDLVPFAELETRRLTYQRDGVNVVVDFTGWGYRVGEIEILVNGRDKVDEAVEKIGDIARELAFKRLDLLRLATNVRG